MADFAGLTHADNPTIEARFRIELSVVGNPTPFFFAEAILRGGFAGAPGTGTTFTENGTSLGPSFFADADFPGNVFGRDFAGFLGTVPLGNLTTSDVVRYVMEVSVSGPGLEAGALAYIGDPFDLAGGGSSIAFAPEPGLVGLLGLAGLVLRRARG